MHPDDVFTKIAKPTVTYTKVAKVVPSYTIVPKSLTYTYRLLAEDIERTPLMCEDNTNYLGAENLA